MAAGIRALVTPHFRNACRVRRREPAIRLAPGFLGGAPGTEPTAHFARQAAAFLASCIAAGSTSPAKAACPVSIDAGTLIAMHHCSMDRGTGGQGSKRTTNSHRREIQAAALQAADEFECSRAGECSSAMKTARPLQIRAWMTSRRNTGSRDSRVIRNEHEYFSQANFRTPAFRNTRHGRRGRHRSSRFDRGRR